MRSNSQFSVFPCIILSASSLCSIAILKSSFANTLSSFSSCRVCNRKVICSALMYKINRLKHKRVHKINVIRPVNIFFLKIHFERFIPAIMFRYISLMNFLSSLKSLEEEFIYAVYSSLSISLQIISARSPSLFSMKFFFWKDSDATCLLMGNNAEYLIINKFCIGSDVCLGRKPFHLRMAIRARPHSRISMRRSRR